MAKRSLPVFEERTIDDLTIIDERSFRHIPLYEDLKNVLRHDQYVFRVLPPEQMARWDRALFFNLTYWGGRGGDVLDGPRIAADVVAHAAWHHLAARASPAKRASTEALFLGESIASAFDVYLVGRLLRHASASRSSFLESQVSAMAESARAAGLRGRSFEAMLEGVAEDPAGSFAELRALLYDAAMALVRCRGANAAMRALSRFDPHRFAPLLHHYELSNWVLYARAYAREPSGKEPRARDVEAAIRRAPDPLAWLAAHWVTPRLAQNASSFREKTRTKSSA